jgi:hypothetical protein
MELGIATYEAEELFACLDFDGNAQLSVVEFVEGCLRVHGPAQAKHLLQVEYDIIRSGDGIRNDLEELAWYVRWLIRHFCRRYQLNVSAPQVKLPQMTLTTELSGASGADSASGAKKESAKSRGSWSPTTRRRSVAAAAVGMDFQMPTEKKTKKQSLKVPGSATSSPPRGSVGSAASGGSSASGGASGRAAGGSDAGTPTKGSPRTGSPRTGSPKGQGIAEVESFAAGSHDGVGSAHLNSSGLGSTATVLRSTSSFDNLSTGTGSGHGCISGGGLAGGNIQSDNMNLSTGAQSLTNAEVQAAIGALVGIRQEQGVIRQSLEDLLGDVLAVKEHLKELYIPAA